MPTPGHRIGKVRALALSGPTGSKEGDRKVMKRIRLLILLGMVAVALPLGLLQGVAKATSSSKTTTTTATSVTISQFADFNTYGAQLDVNLLVRCTGGSGTANVTVKQTTPETADPLAEGTGFSFVVCDGQTHSVGVTVTGGVFDPGKAYATADVTAPSGPAHTVKWITIFVN
jgi:hypothetical protein